MKFNRPTVDVGKAQDLLLQHLTPLEAEIVPLLESFGRTLAEDVHATHPVPHFVKSGMDGYAVRAVDIQGATPETPALLKVNEVIPCGSLPTKPIGPGEAARIMTGAMLPEGADTVVMFEMTEERQEAGGDEGFEKKESLKYAVVFKEVPLGRNVSQIGEEMAAGELLLERGRTIQAGEAALLATFGFSEVPVVRRPRVAIFTTGSELLAVDAPLQPGKIRNSNRYMLTSLVQSASAQVVSLQTVPDDIEQARALVCDWMNRVDVVLTSGGVSVGDFDIMADLLDNWDGQVLFQKIEMRPGSVTSAAARGNAFLCALSGNPGACFVGFELFVRPVLHGLQARRQVLPTAFTAVLRGDYPKANIYARYLRGQTLLHEGKVYVEPVGKDQSSVTVSIKDSDCLIVIPPGGGVRDGEMVTALRLPSQPYA
ncbi:molybdopterin molybdotransferase MoeA [Tumebacillus sp. ITR2]|uniref:Molybdopterin molybdenumtransferase n=1 Tax=Tumebacillus amylolyticus TaxID=2801339 RepID=A0ABS1JDK5_9BACL|nr:gephyrin-like molybdotransferase Glp [Tumebacillus amylolyticus]MBL0388382.1 molybdopterin molybdotransferase MoeA [Tumebacillus amylolyticus]